LQKKHTTSPHPQLFTQICATKPIAHRLSTIRSADQILVLESGEIVERGTHDKLLAAGGRYKQLYDKQYKFESDQFINPGEEVMLVPPKVEIELDDREYSQTVWPLGK